MRCRTAVSILLSAGLLAAAPGQAGAKPPFPEPDQSPDPRGLTISGSGVARVVAPRRPTERSIERAIAAAKPRAYARAVAEARRRARNLARAADLDLGAVQAVRGRDRDVELGGTPSRHCRRRCTVPRFATASAAVTFATAQTSAAAPAGRALVVDGAAAMPVRPRNRRSDGSIRAAFAAARLAAAPRALATARRDARAAAEAAGLAQPLAPGALFAIAEVPRPSWELLGTFGAGRYCGMASRRIVRRDPVTGRRRTVRRVRQRRCFFAREASVAIRVTYLPAP